jgi:outer membrane lipoprotein-sorting protein
MWKKILTISLVLVMALTFTACEEEVDEEVGLPSAQEIVDGVSESLDNIKTFQFDMDMTMDMSGESDVELLEIAVVMDANAAVDVENGQMRMDMTLDMALPGEGEMGVGMEYYLINDVMYMFMEAPEMDPMWMKSEVPAESWGLIDQTESQIELLKTAEFKVIGSEKVKGVDCYVLALTPDMEQLWQTIMQQAAVGGEELLPDVPEEFFQEMFRSFSVKQWIAKDTYYLTKVEIDMAMELTAEAIKVEEGDMSIDIIMTLFIYDYNKPISVVLPPEAEGAIEMPMQ